MNIDKLNDYALKIYLDNDDMENFNINYSDIDANSIRSLIIILSDEIAEILGTNLNNEKFFVEVFARKSGCLIFLSYSGKKAKIKPLKRNIICQFDDFDNLKKFCIYLNNAYAENVIFSKLYCNSHHIRLILGIKSDSEEILKMSEDFCTVTLGNEINIAATDEYFQIVYDKMAVENILQYISQ